MMGRRDRPPEVKMTVGLLVVMLSATVLFVTLVMRRPPLEVALFVMGFLTGGAFLREWVKSKTGLDPLSEEPK